MVVIVCCDNNSRRSVIVTRSGQVLVASPFRVGTRCFTQCSHLARGTIPSVPFNQVSQYSGVV